MFRFAHPDLLYLLPLTALLTAIYALAAVRRRRSLARFGNAATLRDLMPERSPRRRRTKFVLILTALAWMIFAAARPQFGSKLSETRRTGLELMLAVDVSNSMRARDFAPDRLERTKAAIGRLLEGLEQDQVGLVAFAGEAYVQLPITSDYTTARNFVGQLSTDMISRQGTDLAAAIELSAGAFGTDSEGSRVMVLISDGENHENDPLPAAERAREQGITIYAIGIGTPEGVPIPLPNGEMMQDENGEMVVTRLDEGMLERIALATGGVYIRADNQSIGLEQIAERIAQTERQELSSRRFEQFDEQYRYPLAAALVLLLLELTILPRKNPRLARFDIFK